MFRTSLLYVFAAVALAQTQIPPSSGEGPRTAWSQVQADEVTSASGVTIRYKMLASPSLKFVNLFGTARKMDGNTLHRLLCDKSTRSYLGYDLVIESGDATTGYRVSFRPVSNLEQMVEVIAGDTPMRPMPLPKYPAPLVVQRGDIIELDLMVSPDGKQRLTDYIEILAHEPPAATTTAQPLDFTLDDGPVSFGGSQATIWINGRLVEGPVEFTGKPGATFWMTVSDHGRYVLSLAPHDRFTKSGMIRDNVLSFQDGGQQYEVRFMSPIAGAGKAWNLYVLHDQTYEPKPDQRNWVKTGTDRLENLLPKD